MLGPFRVGFSLFPGLFPGFASVPPLSRLAGPTRGAGQVSLNHVRADVLGKLPGCSFFGWRPNFPANFGWLMAKTQRGRTPLVAGLARAGQQGGDSGSRRSGLRRAGAAPASGTGAQLVDL